MLPHSGNKYQDKTQQIGSEAVSWQRRSVYTIRAIGGFLEKLGAEAEDHRRTSRTSPGPSQTMQSANWLDAYAMPEA